MLAGPTVGFQAPEQDPPFGTGEDHGESRFTGPYNLTGHPAVSLPVAAGPGALPIGLQLAGRRGGDAALLPGGRRRRVPARRSPLAQEDRRMPTTTRRHALTLAGLEYPSSS